MKRIVSKIVWEAASRPHQTLTLSILRTVHRRLSLSRALSRTLAIRTSLFDKARDKALDEVWVAGETGIRSWLKYKF